MGFQNGTSRTWHTTSTVIGDFEGVTDGNSFYAKFCSGKPNPDAPAPPTTVPPGPASTPYTPISSPTPPGYPKPVINTHDDIVSGYYLDGANSDVAVLSMLAMENESPAEFQAVVQDFIADAKNSGKKKLVIDVSANSGGYVLLGYDVFRQLFPHIVQDGYTRYRASEGFQAIAAQYVNALKGYNPNTANWEQIEAAESPVYWKYDYNLTNQPFPSEKNKVGPYVFNNDNYTNILRWNLDDPLTTTNTTFGMGMEITGYGDRKNFTQPWAAEDIIVLYDGYCASTCTLLAEFLRTQAGVKSIAIDGRPSTNPMQAIGGVKGANNADFTFQNFLATFAYESLPANQKNSSAAQIFQEYGLYPYYRATDTSINIRDNILPDNLKDQVPAQFIYEKADCRIFYQPQMVTDVSAMWQVAANVAWGNSTCVEGKLDLPKRTAAPSRNPGAPLNPQPLSVPNFPIIEKTSLWRAVYGQRVPV
jgi:Peptidase family S41